MALSGTSRQDTYLRAIGCTHKQHTALCAVRTAAIHLHQHLRLQSPAGLMLTCRCTQLSGTFVSIGTPCSSPMKPCQKNGCSFGPEQTTPIVQAVHAVQSTCKAWASFTVTGTGLQLCVWGHNLIHTHLQVKASTSSCMTCFPGLLTATQDARRIRQSRWNPHASCQHAISWMIWALLLLDRGRQLTCHHLQLCGLSGWNRSHQ